MLVLQLVSASGFTQASGASSVPDNFRVADPDRVRSHIQMERSEAEARYQMQESACYALFSVSDCIRLARVGRREILDKLRQEERVLNDGERQRKALAQIRQLQEKSSAQGLEEVAARRLEGTLDSEQRSERRKQKVDSVASMTSDQGSVVYKAREQGRTSLVIAKEQKLYQDKLTAAEVHRVNFLKVSMEKSSTPVKPLPVSPR